ncbi:MAG: 2OG-Fe(II) oxygenase [Pseudomonadales bacterium]|nr:2OG-Fe(II) oxygenase [Pseudomonadales bacterium]
MTVKLRKFYEIGNQVNDDPLICVFEDFLSEDEIQSILSVAESKLKQALVSAEKSGVESAGRSGSNCWIPHTFNEVIEGLCLRIAEVVGIGLEYAESLQVVHYQTDQQYAPHFDAWDPGTERGKRCLAKGGQRMVTCLLYLNDPPQGGGTCFPELDMEIRAKQSRMVLFHNCRAGTSTRHPGSLHGGMPVLAGEKWACNLWFREEELRAPRREDGPGAKRGTQSKFSRVI